MSEEKKVVKQDFRDYTKGPLLFQGAESKVYIVTYSAPSVSTNDSEQAETVSFVKKAILKHRFAKTYRNPILDLKLREQRTQREARALERCRLRYGIHTPEVYYTSNKHESCEIIMEYIENGSIIKDLLDVENQKRLEQAQVKETGPSAQTIKLLVGLGYTVGRLHAANVIHGDLTSSNFMYIPTLDLDMHNDTSSATRAALEEKETIGEGVVQIELYPNTPHPSHTSASSNDRPQQRQIPNGASTSTASNNTIEKVRTTFHPNAFVALDFGLVHEKPNEEEKAVDLYVLERAIISTHPFIESYAMDLILAGYRVGAVTLQPTGNQQQQQQQKKASHNNSNTNNKMNAEKRVKMTLDRLQVVRARGRKRSMVG